MTSVLITVPCEHWIHHQVVHRLLLLQKDQRYRCTVILPSHRPYENNQHHIVRDFIADGYDFWLSIDADNPPAARFPKLIDSVSVSLSTTTRISNSSSWTTPFELEL